MSEAGILKVIFDNPVDLSYFSRMVDIDHKNQYDPKSNFKIGIFNLFTT